MSTIRLVGHDQRAPRRLALQIDDLLGEGIDVLIVDLAGARPDAMLLHLLVVTDKTLAARGGRLIVLCSQGQPRAVLRECGLDNRLSVAENLAHAADLADPPGEGQAGAADEPVSSA